MSASDVSSGAVADLTAITFRRFCKYTGNYAYNPKYEAAFIGDELLQNKDGVYLSRMFKKNGKHRYYLTEEHETVECSSCGEDRCTSQYCRSRLEYSYYFTSTYLGRDMVGALQKGNLLLILPTEKSTSQ
jgi:hypothetical protein